MRVKSISEVRAQFQDMVDHVHYTKTPLIITKNRKPWVMIEPLPEEDHELEKLIKEKLNSNYRE